ncbi:MAG: NAD(P)-dependent oxidoreductase [Proteobacteria bacterium]|nr:NAD(P)-dependent oxidoreductase [Pseudomonadota bacterium]
MSRSQPILVTGAAGLIGRALVETLLRRGRVVVAVDRVAPPDPAAFETVIAELADAPRLNAIVAAGVDGIIHCGAISGPMLARDRPAEIAAVNIGGTVNMLEAARLARVRRFIFCSSIAAYGATPAGVSPVGEDAPLAATDIYGASKAAADLMVRAYARAHGVDAAVLRLGWVYGPRRRTRSLLHTLIRDALAGTPTNVDHDGAYCVQMVHVDDVVAALIAAYDAIDLRRRAFNVTGGTRVAMRDLATLVKAALPRAVFRFTPDIVLDDDHQERFALAAAVQAFGWSPGVSLEVGIAGYAEWLSLHAY